MRADDVLNIFRRFIDGERAEAKRGLELMRHNELAANRMKVATDIERLLSRMNCLGGGALVPLPHNAQSHLEQIAANVSLDNDLCLTYAQRQSVRRFVDEWKARGVLAEHGVPVRTTVLLHGPSGNGKTSLAQAIANSAELPLFRLRHGILDSHLGATSQNIDKIGMAMRPIQCVLLIDECDSFLSARRMGDSAAGLEANRIVNSLLQFLDSVGPNVIVVFCTNFEQSLDLAFQRRIGLTMEMPAPNADKLGAFLIFMTERLKYKLGNSDIAEIVRTAKSYAQAQEMVFDVMRRAIVGRLGVPQRPPSVFDELLGKAE